jgi:hypothetical protein
MHAEAAMSHPEVDRRRMSFPSTLLPITVSRYVIDQSLTHDWLLSL